MVNAAVIEKRAYVKNLFISKLRQVRSGIFALLAIGFFINLLMLASPLYMLQIYDRVLTSRSIDTLILLTLIVTSALVVIGLLEATRSVLMGRISRWMSTALSGETLRVSIQRTLRLEQSANVQSLRDLDALRSFLTTPVIYPLVDAPWSSIYLCVIFMLHPILGWIALGGACLLLIIAIVNDRLTRKGQQLSTDITMQAIRQAESAVKNVDVVQAMGMTNSIIDRWESTNKVVLEQQARTGLLNGNLSALSRFIRLSIQAAILGGGAFLAIGGDLSAGAIVAASILVGRALSPVDQIISTWRSARSAKVAYDRLSIHFQGQHLQQAKTKLPIPKGDVSIEGLTYIYPGTQECVLRAINFQLIAGDSLAVIGPSGSGKTTLIRVILGNLLASSGHARLDGMDVTQWESDDRGQYIGYLPQDVELFAGTVSENIARMGSVNSQNVIKAAKMADVHEMIMRLPKGYDTEIGTNGMALSGGQRQRIALARALYGEPRLVILDEPNSNLDQVGDAALEKALKNLKQSKITTIVISHRPSVLKSIDKVLVLQEGAVSAFGPKEEIFKSTPIQATSKIKQTTVRSIQPNNAV